MACILVVEDDPNSARVLRCLLRSAGHNVVVSLDASEILQRCRSGDVDLGLFDVSLSGCTLNGLPIDGNALCRLINPPGNERRVPIILVTAHAMHGDAERLLEDSGADDYVSKPILDHDALLRLVERHLQLEPLHV